MSMLTPVVLAGGAGTRLWPLSREEYPKQLLKLTGANTLLQETVMRLNGLNFAGLELTPTEPLLVTNEEHRFLVREQIEQIGRDTSEILLEPVSRNTAPALTLAALHLLDEDAVLLVMPADHVMTNIGAFHETVLAAAKLARDGVIVTFGIVPNRVETGYGYIRTGETEVGDGGAKTIAAFVEKPDAAAAASYLASGKYLWNSGMFMLRASVWIDAIDRHRPDILSACRAAKMGATQDGSFVRVDSAAFEACSSDSIDYAVMERLAASQLKPAADGREGEAIPAAVVPLDAGWSDVGSWPALIAINQPDAVGNVCRGDVFSCDTEGSLILANDRLVATLGLRDTVVVETADAVLVAHKDHGQDVKMVVDWLNASKREESKCHRRVFRPWGSYEGVASGDRYQVKRLTVKPGASLSLQMHHHRAEHWVVVRGTAKVVRGDEEFLLTENESTYIPLGAAHRLENPGTVELEVIEVQSGGYLGEDDIVRFEDRYDRVR